MSNDGDFFFARLGIIYPMYLGSASFHTPEPCHLSLGKLMDGNLELVEHLLIRELADDMERKVLVLQSVVDEIVGLQASVKQSSHLVDHASFKTFIESLGNTFAPHITVDVDADNQTLHRRITSELLGMSAVVVAYLYLAYGTFGCVGVGGVVERLIGL